MAITEIKNCENCNIIFKSRKQQYGFEKYCQLKCYYEFKKKLTEKRKIDAGYVKCPLCGRYFKHLNGSHARNGHGYTKKEDFLRDAGIYAYEGRSRLYIDTMREAANKSISEGKIDIKKLGESGKKALQKFWKRDLKKEEWLKLNESGRNASAKYYQKYFEKQPTFTCMKCKREFTYRDISNSQANTFGRKYCSLICYTTHKMIKKCYMCNTEIEVHPLKNRKICRKCFEKINYLKNIEAAASETNTQKSE